MRAHTIIMRAHAMINACHVMISARARIIIACMGTHGSLRGHALLFRGHVVIAHALIIYLFFIPGLYGPPYMTASL